MKILFKILGTLMTAAFFMYLFLAVFMATQSYKVIKNYTARQGKVVNVQTKNVPGSSTASSTTAYAPVISFKDKTGADSEFISSDFTASSTYKKNSIVSILFDPLHPGHVQINSFDNLWLGSIAYGILSLIFLVAAWLCLRTKKDKSVPTK